MSSTTSENEKPKVGTRRRHLRPEEAQKLIAAAGKRGRYPERDKLLLLRLAQSCRCDRRPEIGWIRVSDGARTSVSVARRNP
jgi:hypothetical protein